MKTTHDIYQYQDRLRSALKSLKNAPISQRNRDFILEFRENCAVMGIGFARMVRYITVLKSLAKRLAVDFDKATREDITKVISWLEENPDYSAWTKYTYKVMIKRFYKWLLGPDEYPEQVKWIKTQIKQSDMKLPANGDLLTEEEIKKLIENAVHVRNKAFVSVLYEGGPRIGEILSAQIKDVKPDKYGAVIQVNGKTGPRPIRLVSSVPFLMAWLNAHPYKNDINAPIWVNIGTRNQSKPSRYPAIRKMLQSLFQRANIQKSCNPHFFRHSRATYLADFLTEFQMNQYFGWVQGSNMAATYIHMSGKNIDSSILRLNGIESDKEDKRESLLSPKICSRCDTINAYDNKFCSKCAGLLDIKTALEIQEKQETENRDRQLGDNVMGILMKDSEFKEFLTRKVQELKGKESI